jgi:phasin
MTEKAVREFADKSAEAMEQTYSAASKGAADFNLHLLEIVQENMNAAFDFARQLTRVTSPSQFFELYAAHARKQLETFTAQTRQLTNLAQKATTEAAQPLQAAQRKSVPGQR